MVKIKETSVQQTGSGGKSKLTTIPATVCTSLGINEKDTLEWYMDNKKRVIIKKKED